MSADQPFAFAPQQGSLASPFDNAASPFREAGSPQLQPPGSATGSNAPLANTNATPSRPQQQQQSPMSIHSGAAAARPSAVKAPWDEDDDDWNAPSQKAFPAEPRATQQSPPHGDMNDFVASSPPMSLNRSPTPLEKPNAADTAKMDALNKQIATRTAAMDAATKEKESKIVAAAQDFIKAQKARREKEVLEAKAHHKKEQQADASKVDAYKKSGALWNAVGMLVDLQKPNPYSKGTEQMRSILSTLNATPTAAGASSVAAGGKA